MSVDNRKSVTNTDFGRSTAGSGRLGLRAVRAFKASFFAALLLLVLYGIGFVLFANHVAGLQMPEEPPDADAIIVLTGGHLRLEPAVALLRAGKGQRLLISGVHPDTDIASLRRVTGADASLFQCCIDIDHMALDTAGNAEETAKWLKAHKFSSAIIVTNNYHVPRSLFEMRRKIGSAALSPYPVVNSRIDRLRWISDREVLRVLFIEYAKYVAALGRNMFSV